MSATIRCPHCGGTNTKTSIKGKMTNAMAYGVGAVANSVISNFLPFDTHGTGAIATGIKGFVPIEYECEDCDCLFTVTIDSDKEVKQVEVRQYPMPDAIIQEEKDAYISDMKSQISYKSAIVCGLISVGLFIYCWNTDFKYQVWREGTWFQKAGYYNDWHYSWLFWALLCIVFFISAIVNICSTESKEEKVKEAEQASLIEFKRKHPEIFKKYPQYR